MVSWALSAVRVLVEAAGGDQFPGGLAAALLGEGGEALLCLCHCSLALGACSVWFWVLQARRASEGLQWLVGGGVNLKQSSLAINTEPGICSAALWSLSRAERGGSGQQALP